METRMNPLSINYSSLSVSVFKVLRREQWTCLRKGRSTCPQTVCNDKYNKRFPDCKSCIMMARSCKVFARRPRRKSIPAGLFPNIDVNFTMWADLKYCSIVSTEPDFSYYWSWSAHLTVCSDFYSIHREAFFSSRFARHYYASCLTIIFGKGRVEGFWSIFELLMYGRGMNMVFSGTTLSTWASPQHWWFWAGDLMTAQKSEELWGRLTKPLCFCFSLQRHRSSTLISNLQMAKTNEAH